jgi:hypothetical protein
MKIKATTRGMAGQGKFRIAQRCRHCFAAVHGTAYSMRLKKPKWFALSCRKGYHADLFKRAESIQ